MFRRGRPGLARSRKQANRMSVTDKYPAGDAIARSTVLTAYQEVSRNTIADAEAGLADIRRRSRTRGTTFGNAKADPTGIRRWDITSPHLIAVAAVTGTAVVATIMFATIMTFLARPRDRPMPAAAYPQAPSASYPSRGQPEQTRPPRPLYARRRLHREIVGNPIGTVVFTNPQGGATDGFIPFGQDVQVKCWAQNESGIASINEFYRIVTAPWTGDYAPANTFTNGGPLGAAGSADIDPAVPECRKS